MTSFPDRLGLIVDWKIGKEKEKNYVRPTARTQHICITFAEGEVKVKKVMMKIKLIPDSKTAMVS